MRTEQQIEALLFYKGEPVSTKDLASLLKISEDEVLESARKLSENLSERGINLVVSEKMLELRTAPNESTLIESMRKEELSRDLGKAGSEVLSIILYKGPVTRSEIDYIRGVNSTFILRNLLIRGLVEKTPNPKDNRSYLYHTTTELLSLLGVKTIEDLPDYQNVQSELKKFEEESKNENAIIENTEETTDIKKG